MSPGRFAILDPAAGISGDMILGALISAGAPAAWLVGLPARLGFPEVKVELAQVDRCGVAATKVTVRLPDGRSEEPHSHYHGGPHHGAHPHEHAHGQEPHRHIGELVSLVQRAPISAWVKERASRAFALLGEAEGKVHEVPAAEVHLHEVGAIDALVDIVGAIEGFERLGIESVYSRPVALGSGWVQAAHGVLPVPAPATAILLEGLEIGANGPVSGEATTPTGAALLRVLSSGSPPAQWRALGGGWGAGGRNPPDYPNALRLTLAEPAAEAGEVVLVATDIDDLSPEYLDPLREAVLAAGALDVQVWATQMKKGRTGFRLEALTSPGAAAAVTEAIFCHSTTAGVRRWTAERVTLARREVEVVAASGIPIRVKILEGPGGPRVKPEYDDIAAAARHLGRPAHEVAQEVRQRALGLVTADADGGAGAGQTHRTLKESE